MANNRNSVTRELRLDLDGARLPLLEVVRRLARVGRTLVTIRETRSPSGRGWHQWIVIRPAPRSAVEIVALQLLLGSDPLREAYNLRRALAVDSGTVSVYWRMQDRWNVLYQWSSKWKSNGVSFESIASVHRPRTRRGL